MKKLGKVFALIISVIMVFGVFSGCTAKGDVKELNLYTWDGVFPKELLDRFTEETGIKINFTHFDSDEEMLTKLATAKGGTYDLVIADDYAIKSAITEELVQKLDPAKIPNLGNVNPVYQKQFYDPADEYSVPHGAGVQTIVYDPAKVNIDIKGYKDLWDESLKDEISLIANARVIDGMALNTLGYSLNSKSETEIREAGAELIKLAPNIRVINDNNAQDQLLSGEVSVSVMYTSQVTQALMARPDFKVVFPEEGIGFGIMAQFIPINAPNADNAHAFINFLLDAENSAEAFEYFGYYCTNIAAEEFISDEFKPFLTLPTELKSEDMEIIEPLEAEYEEIHEQIWTEFKSAAGQ